MLVIKRLHIRPHDTNSPHRRLMAGILLQAYRDVRRREHHHDIAAFLDSGWCEILCDGVDISGERYAAKVRAVMG